VLGVVEYPYGELVTVKRILDRAIGLEMIDITPGHPIQRRAARQAKPNVPDTVARQLNGIVEMLE